MLSSYLFEYDSSLNAVPSGVISVEAVEPGVSS